MALALLSVVVSMALGPRILAGRAPERFYLGDREARAALARNVSRRVTERSDPLFYHTKSSRFDGQSAIAIYQMTLLGLGQIVLDHPELRDAHLQAMRVAAERLVDPSTLSYATRVYGSHGVHGMAPTAGHAYLGYINLGLGMLRLVEPDTRHAALHDRLTQELARRLFASRTGLIETYPGETWPPDVAAVAGSIGLHARATGRDVRAEMTRWGERFARCSIHSSGYLVQRVRSGSCIPVDAPRGSGTAVASYFLSFADAELSERLYQGLAHEGRASLFGLGALREYAPGFSGEGDGNAGPMLFGVSVGATGFGIAAARVHADRELFTELTRTALLFGIPHELDGETSFVVGGALGNALLLAMLTARPP